MNRILTRLQANSMSSVMTKTTWSHDSGQIVIPSKILLHDIGDQLSRRSVYIHLPRYNAEFTEDREIWQSVVWGEQLQIPTAQEPDFLLNWEYLYERSLECIGILKNWSKNAFADAIDEGASTVTLKHLEWRALSVGQCRNILKKIQESNSIAQSSGKRRLTRSAARTRL